MTQPQFKEKCLVDIEEYFTKLSNHIASAEPEVDAMIADIRLDKHALVGIFPCCGMYKF